MEESATYQHLMAIGPFKAYQKGIEHGLYLSRFVALQLEMHSEARRILILAAEPKFGSPSPMIKTAIEKVIDLDCLESLAARIYTSSSWDELLKTD